MPHVSRRPRLPNTLRNLLGKFSRHTFSTSHTPPKEPPLTLTGGSPSSILLQSCSPYQAPPSCTTTMRSQMQAQEWALASLWENIGVHGSSSATGSPRVVTSGGRRQLPLNSLPVPSFPSTAPTTTSNATATTQASSKGGGKVPVKTPRPTVSSGVYMTLSRTQERTSTPVTSPVNTILQTRLHEESSVHPTASCPLSSSQMLSSPLFEMRLNLQLGLNTPTPLPSASSDVGTPLATTPSTGTWSKSARKSSPPQPPGTTTPSRLHAV